MLKLVLETLEGLSDEIKANYKQGGDGKFHLTTEEDVDTKKKIDEFRDNNIKLKKELDEMSKKFGAIDLEEIAKMKKRLEGIDDEKMVAAGKIDELVAQKVERMKADYENQINALKTALEERDGKLNQTGQRLSEVLIDSEITKAVNAVGVVRKEAMRDILSRGRSTWRLDDDGKPTPKEGDRLLYGKDGKAPLTFDEWAATLMITAPFLFEASGGGGAGGGSANRGGAGGQVDVKTLPPQERLKYLHGGEGATGMGQK